VVQLSTVSRLDRKVVVGPRWLRHARDPLEDANSEYELGTPDLSKAFGNFLEKVFHSLLSALRDVRVGALSSLVDRLACSPSGLEARPRGQGYELVELNWVRRFEALLVERLDIFACPVPRHLAIDS